MTTVLRMDPHLCMHSQRHEQKRSQSNKLWKVSHQTVTIYPFIIIYYSSIERSQSEQPNRLLDNRRFQFSQ